MTSAASALSQTTITFSVLEIENLAVSVHLDLLREIAESDGFSDFDRSDLVGEVGRKVVDDACEFAPGAFNVENECLTAEFAGQE